MRTLKTQVSDRQDLAYDGSQLRPHWIYETFDILGDAVVAFTGSADVPLSHMVDKEDVKNKAPIASQKMLHFLGEWFDESLEVAILRQHFFTGLIYEMLWEKSVPHLSRRGNDLYIGGKKLSVSIATRSQVSTLLHVGLNITSEGTPIPTSALNDAGIEPYPFAKACLERFQADFETWEKARCKVQSR